MDALKLLKDTFKAAGYSILPRDELMLTVIEKAYREEVQMAIAALFNLTERVSNLEDVLKGPLAHVPNKGNTKKTKPSSLEGQLMNSHETET